jgi:predicted nucleic acid-binding protein
VASLVAGDVHHAQSRAFLEAARERSETLVSPGLVVPEVAGAVSRRTSSPLLARGAVRALKLLPVLRLFVIDDALVDSAARIAADHGLRGADAFYVAVAKRLSSRLVTWDREQAQRALGVIAAGPPAL